jgi:hypothetical protein
MFAGPIHLQVVRRDQAEAQPFGTRAFALYESAARARKNLGSGVTVWRWREVAEDDGIRREVKTWIKLATCLCVTGCPVYPLSQLPWKPVARISEYLQIRHLLMSATHICC